MNYKEAGVDIEKGDLFIDRIKPFIKETYNENVISGVGGFAALYDQGDFYLATGTDGVGTKLKLATELGIHDTIGQDLVAMCANDILCTGAQSMFFLDYLATSKLDLEVHTQVVKGIAHGCKLAGCALVGGETAEMPGMYQDGEYDLAGFVVGHLPKDKVIDGSKIKPGMKIYALPSSGFHSNGYSLIRNLIKNDDSTEFKKELLTPTRIYANEVKTLMSDYQVAGIAHITGGGLNNIKRMNPSLGYDIQTLPKIPAFMQTIIKRSEMSNINTYQTFNMGMGLCFVCEDNPNLLNDFSDLICIGEVSKKFIGVRVLEETI